MKKREKRVVKCYFLEKHATTEKLGLLSNLFLKNVNNLNRENMFLKNVKNVSRGPGPRAPRERTSAPPSATRLPAPPSTSEEERGGEHPAHVALLIAFEGV